MLRLILALVLALPMFANAQEDYDAGSYWAITAVDTKPTRFDDYIRDISGLWKSQLEMLMADGKVLSYKMLSNVHAREGEPDLWLMVEWASAGAMMDTPWEYYEDMMDEIAGGMKKVEKMSLKREEIREIMGEVLAREISFKEEADEAEEAEEAEEE